VITPEAVNRLKDELAGYSWLQKHTTMSKVKNMDRVTVQKNEYKATGYNNLETQQQA
jgi:hypothetical protein